MIGRAVMTTMRNWNRKSDDDDNSDDSNPADLKGKYDGKGNKKRKGGSHRYRDNNNIENIHILYNDQEDDDGDCG